MDVSRMRGRPILSNACSPITHPSTHATHLHQIHPKQRRTIPKGLVPVVQDRVATGLVGIVLQAAQGLLGQITHAARRRSSRALPFLHSIIRFEFEYVSVTLPFPARGPGRRRAPAYQPTADTAGWTRATAAQDPQQPPKLAHRGCSRGRRVDIGKRPAWQAPRCPHQGTSVSAPGEIQAGGGRIQNRPSQLSMEPESREPFPTFVVIHPILACTCTVKHP